MLTRRVSLPAKRMRPKMGIPKGPQREWLRHRKFVRGRGCCVPECQGRAEFAHIRNAANSGTGLKPFDWYGVGLCRLHHQEQHDCGVGTFQDRHGIDLYALAARYVDESPDSRMRVAKTEAALDTPAPALPVSPRTELPASDAGRQDKTAECPGADLALITPSAGGEHFLPTLATGISPANDDTPEPLGFTWFPVWPGQQPVMLPIERKVS